MDTTKKTIILFSGEFDKVMAALIIANGAAAMGDDVTIFCTFWGLNILRREHDKSNRKKSFGEKVLGWLNPSGPSALPLSHLHFWGVGTALMQRSMSKQGFPELPWLMAKAQQAGVRLIANNMSMSAMGLKPEDLIDGVEVGEMTDLLDAAKTSSATLFI